MIISHKYRFLFIGLPFSASSAISKELYVRYGGESILRKHSLYYEFQQIAKKEQNNYFVFAVLRNPMQIIISLYEKMKANTKGNFTNLDLFIENGGHITKKDRLIFNFIHDEQATFQQYFCRFFHKPYDNLTSLTLKHCDYVIKYENIAEDYLTALKQAGIKKVRPLPVENKTVGKTLDITEYYTDDIKDRAIFVFGPFLKKHNMSFPKEWGEISLVKTSIVQFHILSILRKIYYKYFKRYSKKIGLQGTIYGDIERKI